MHYLKMEIICRKVGKLKCVHKEVGDSAIPLTYRPYSKRINILRHRRAGILKCYHTGFEHAHNCHNVIKFHSTDLGHVYNFKKTHSTDFGARKISKRDTVLATVCPKATLISFSRWIPAHVIDV